MTTPKTPKPHKTHPDSRTTILQSIENTETLKQAKAAAAYYFGVSCAQEDREEEQRKKTKEQQDMIAELTYELNNLNKYNQSLHENIEALHAYAAGLEETAIQQEQTTAERITYLESLCAEYANQLTALHEAADPWFNKHLMETEKHDLLVNLMAIILKQRAEQRERTST